MGFFKDNQNLLIVLAVIIFLWYSLSTNLIALPSASQSIVNVEVDGGSNPTNTLPTTSTSTQVDLRGIALPYLAATDVQTTCETLGGIWHWESNWIGCEGIGSFDCSQALAVAASSQCSAVGADWTCNLNNIYCKQ